MGGSDFVRVVRRHFGPALEGTGLTFNTGSDKAVLYEGLPEVLTEQYPHLDPSWDTVWHEQAICVDLWIEYDPATGAIEASLEHWDVVKLAEEFGSDELADRCGEALAAGDDLDSRLAVLAEVFTIGLCADSGPSERGGLEARKTRNPPP